MPPQPLVAVPVGEFGPLPDSVDLRDEPWLMTVRPILLNAASKDHFTVHRILVC